jgi:hypothetical protein
LLFTGLDFATEWCVGMRLCVDDGELFDDVTHGGVLVHFHCVGIVWEAEAAIGGRGFGVLNAHKEGDARRERWLAIVSG